MVRISTDLRLRLNPLYLLQAGSLIILSLFAIMELGESRTVFNELIPPDCTQDGDFGCLCVRNIDCNQTKYLECIDGKCACAFSLRRAFDISLEKCVSLVDSYCGSWKPECTRNSECDGGKCLCRSGYSRTRNNTCLINYMEECGPGQCNKERGLACKEEKCQCLDASFAYSVLHRKCIDPELVARNLMQGFFQRIITVIVNNKLSFVIRKVTLPFRVLKRILLGPFG